MTKHSPDYWVLMSGRVLGGIATSLLFSAFESWVVAEHFSKGFDERWLGDTFSKAGPLLDSTILAGIHSAASCSFDFKPVPRTSV